ncbi:MAG TPA: hypothetical protein VMF65_13715 [Acidimicrobiales bacterium]|nr:hypothetical protein [Acidimicrobiales bacterium]
MPAGTVPGAQEAPAGGATTTTAAPLSHPVITRGRPTWQEVLVVLGISTFLAALFLHNAWRHPLSTQVGVFGDADEYTWFLAWVPYAIGHGLNPLGSTFVNFPHGINLMWNTSALLPSFLMSPVTVVFGAGFSYNVLATAAPALSTTFAYMAFRRWTAPVPSFAGALVFGFSSYIVAQSIGHLAQTLLPTAPLILIVLDRLLVVQAGRAWLDGLTLGLLAWAQLLTGEEVLAFEVVAAIIAVVVLVAINDRAIFPHVRYAAKGLVVSGGSFLVLSAPFLAYQFLGPNRVQNAHAQGAYVNDLLNFVIPTSLAKFAPAAALNLSDQFRPQNISEQDAYIGIPLLLFIALTLFIARRRRVTWVAFSMGLGCAILSLGPSLRVLGTTTTFELPDAWLQDLPLFRNVLPDRFASMMFLSVGWLVALGWHELRRFKLPVRVPGFALAGLGLVALIPITSYPAAASPMYAAFDTGLACPRPTSGPQLSPRPVALVLPAMDEMALRWQPEAKFCYAMPTATGMAGTNSGDIGNEPLMLTVGQPGQPLPVLTPAVRQQAAANLKTLDIKEIIVAPEYPYSGVPAWDPNGQAQLIAWLEGLLGQVPVNSHDAYFTYVWKDLPSNKDIATGHVAYIRGAL